MWTLLAALGFGVASALVPILNAEAYLLANAFADDATLLVLVALVIGVGQTVGKIAIFVAARRGSRASWLRRERTREPRTGRLATRTRRTGSTLMQWLSHPWGGGVTVLVSATVGIPPLAVVAVLAGTSQVRLAVFATCCLIGRCVRFLAVASPVLIAMHR